MSNKLQLQTNNTKVASLIEVLQSKAIPSGEDVTTETNAYTTKIDSLESAVTALETELAGKTSGGSAETCTVHLEWFDDMDYQPFTFMYSDGSGRVISHTTSAADNPSGVNYQFIGDITCVKGSLLYIPSDTVAAPGWGYISFTGAIERPLGEYTTIFAINGDGTISY